jgi:hypothetical protein
LSQWQADPTNRWLDWEWLLRVEPDSSIAVEPMTTFRRFPGDNAPIVIRQ